MKRILAVLTIGAFLAVAAAQDVSEPFFDDTLTLSRAYGLEMVAARLRVLEAYSIIEDDDLLEQIEKMQGRDSGRFLGTLEARDADVAARLVAALTEVEDAAEDGEDPTAAIAEARGVWTEAYAVLVSEAQRNDPAFKAALMADLLLEDDGVAEALEDALEEEEFLELPNGWSALVRVNQLWSELEPLATDEQKSFADQYLGFMAEIYPSHEVPETLPDNPEEAEAPAQSMVGILESVTGASLYSGRDLGRLSAHLETIVAPACQAFAAGNDAVAMEHIYATRNPYRKQLRRLLDLVAPDVHAVAGGILDAFVGADDAPAPENAVTACNELLEALEEATAALGG